MDSSDLWVLNVTASPAVWRNITSLCSGDLPRPLSGSRMQFDPLGDQLVLMGGYSCTSNYASGLGGGTACYTNSVWTMSLNDATRYQWTEHSADPNWPSPRAWHSTIMHGQQLWVYGGQFQDASATVYFYNDVQLFDLAQLAWQAVKVKGATPPVTWSQTSSLVLSPDDGILHMVNMGGCASTAYYPDVYALKLNTAVSADNCEVTGAGMASTTAGVPAHFIIQTRTALNISNSSAVSTSGAQAGHNVVFGDILSYGVQLAFDVLVIGQVGGISTKVESSVVELGNGLYNVTYLACGGVATTCGDVSGPAQVTVFITLDGEYLPFTPFNVPVLPSTFVAAQTSVSGQTDAVQGKTAYLTIQPADEYGNVAQGALNASLLTVAVDGQRLPVSAVSAATAGVYEVQYVAPAQPQYTLTVLLDGQPLLGSPFAVSALANMDVSDVEVTAMRVLAGAATLCLLLGMLALCRSRAVPKVKAASPLFLFFILLGCQLCLIAVLLPVAQQPSTSSSTCGAYAFTLSVGFTLTIASLASKTWRIARIFDRRKLQVRKITDRSLLLPVAALVAADVLLNVVWLAVDPLLPTDFVSSSNALLHYTACSSRNSLLWYSLQFVPKGLLLAYGVVLASQVRNVPSAFNESKWIGLAVYNIAFCSAIVLAILLLLSTSPSAVFVIRSIGVIWCVLATGGLMLLPKLQGGATVDPTAAASSNGTASEYKVTANSEQQQQQQQLTPSVSSPLNKGSVSTHSSTGRTVKLHNGNGSGNGNGQLPLRIIATGSSAVVALDSHGGVPHRSPWHRAAGAMLTPSSSRALHRTTASSADFKGESANGTPTSLTAAARNRVRSTDEGRSDAPLSSLSTPLVPLHSPQAQVGGSKRTALLSDVHADVGAPTQLLPTGTSTPSERVSTDRIIAQLQQQVTALNALLDTSTSKQLQPHVGSDERVANSTDARRRSF